MDAEDILVHFSATHYSARWCGKGVDALAYTSSIPAHLRKARRFLAKATETAVGIAIFVAGVALSLALLYGAALSLWSGEWSVLELLVLLMSAAACLVPLGIIVRALMERSRRSRAVRPLDWRG